MPFKLSNLNSNLALSLGYLNPALNNSAQTKSSLLWVFRLLHESGAKWRVKEGKRTYNPLAVFLALFSFHYPHNLNAWNIQDKEQPLLL